MTSEQSSSILGGGGDNSCQNSLTAHPRHLPEGCAEPGEFNEGVGMVPGDYQDGDLFLTFECQEADLTCHFPTSPPHCWLHAGHLTSRLGTESRGQQGRPAVPGRFVFRCFLGSKRAQVPPSCRHPPPLASLAPEGPLTRADSRPPAQPTVGGFSFAPECGNSCCLREGGLQSRACSKPQQVTADFF